MRKSEIIRIVSFLLIFMIAIVIAYLQLKRPVKLKIYNPADINPALVDTSVQDVSKKHRIADFELINQDGKIVTQKDFEGVIYVADFFFTTCPSICPKMSTQMQRVVEEFKDNDQIMLLSHTVYPEIDSVPVLAEYAKKYNADSKKWMLVTGDKKHIYELARKSYFAITTEGSGDEDDFIHTENFILIDKKKRIRGFYDGTSPEDVDRLIEEIKILQGE